MTDRQQANRQDAAQVQQDDREVERRKGQGRKHDVVHMQVPVSLAVLPYASNPSEVIAALMTRGRTRPDRSPHTQRKVRLTAMIRRQKL